MAGIVTLGGMAALRTITIVGGGLAGLALGIALRRREVPVIVHEAGFYPRHRVCGEFLSGQGERVLQALGVGDVLDAAVTQRTTVWFRGGRPIYAAALPHPARGISRFVLDDALRGKLVGLGGVVQERSRLRPEPGEGRVWCGGRIPAKGDWVGLKCHVPELALAADLEMHLGSNGYVGLARVENRRVNVCGLFRCEKALGGRLTSTCGAVGWGIWRRGSKPPEWRKVPPSRWPDSVRAGSGNCPACWRWVTPRE